ncbi:restriction endonuclease subunit S [Chitinophaga sp. G-6-1-13]|uniref:Restriction endonuclease subunit S n=1 Tax=Chitinophaga fulva TaxID=2728842 RepID=A0A848GKI3_9BACT|nr:restriction endonuclease subunit S [Chitinophaga fulva]NML38181.1 restriction endonuclease subunit S [Chitinophaga fulva]
MITGSIKLHSIDKDLRFNGAYFLNKDALNSRVLEENIDGCSRLGDLAKVWNPQIFKRQFCLPGINAVPYCQSSDVSNTLEGSEIYVNKFQADKVGSIVEEKQILITGFGTIGNIRLVNELSKGMCYANNVCRVEANFDIPYGYLYAVLLSKYGRSQLNKNASGSVVRYIEAPGIKKTLIPKLTPRIQKQVHEYVVEASALRVDANNFLRDVQVKLKNKAGLKTLSTSDYEYFGSHSNNRRVSVFKKKFNEISSLSINAFNYSKRIECLENEIKESEYKLLSACLDENLFFSSGSFKRLELSSPNSIRLLNQSDIFNLRKQGKLLANLYAKSDRLVEYGEVLIAGVGTLGEGETFCRTIFASEELEGQLISGEFIRMKTNDKVPSGYLYAWLASDYGFRLIRKTQTGTKLCRPIQELLKNIPVPIIDEEEMLKIDRQVKKAHTMLYEALNAENKAIELVENEIESWQKS